MATDRGLKLVKIPPNEHTLSTEYVLVDAEQNWVVAGGGNPPGLLLEEILDELLRR